MPRNNPDQDLLDLMAYAGATLKELVTEIDRSRPRTETARDEAWLYAWALIKRRQRMVIAAVQNGEDLGETDGNTGAG